MAQASRGKRKALRPPFLVTVVTIAAVPGCGGAVTGETGGAGGSGGSFTTSSTETWGTTTNANGGAPPGMTSGGGDPGFTMTTGPIPTTGVGGAAIGGAGGGTSSTCPSLLPPSGARCATEGQRCTYPYCPSFPTKVEMVCIAGQWQMPLVTTCNPPPPDAGPCPFAEPTVGDACPFGVRCSYVATCCGAPVAKKTYYCSGTWQYESYDWGTCRPDAGGVSPFTTTDSGPRPFDAGWDSNVPCSDIVLPDVYVPPPNVRVPEPPARDASVDDVEQG